MTWIEARLLELSNLRSRAAQGRVGSTPLGSLQKVATSGANQRTSSLLVDLMGPAGQVGFDYDATLHGDDGAGPPRRRQCRSYARRANSIEGGTDEIQRNIIGERVWGCPVTYGSTRPCRGATSRAVDDARRSAPRLAAYRDHRRRASAASPRA